jgi:hypothetical protein
MPELTRESLIEAAKSAAEKTGPDLSRADFLRVTGITDHQIARLFPEGRWSEVKRLAGLDRHTKHNSPLDDETILKEFHRVASELGQIPTWALFAHKANISADVVRRRFGGLQGTLTAYRDWLEKTEPASPLLEQLHAKSRHEIPTPPVAADNVKYPASPSWVKIDGPVYGAPIDFRGLRHAPVNEQGVVFLFGMVAYELGFIVEAVHATFPDCEAKRCIDAKNQRWQRVRIEFEYQSRTFRDHGHDPNGCDLIVCWEHNWPECPMQVLELRRILDDLDG